MKYIARPVMVQAFKIVSVGPVLEGEPPLPLAITTDDGQNRVATPGMLARFIPQPGDYWVIQSDGYEYLNPKAVFERKYMLATNSPHSTGF